MDELADICTRYYNINKNEIKNLNLKIYTKDDFLNLNKYGKAALHYCCKYNKILGPKYFVKRYGVTKDEIMIRDIYNENCLHKALLNKQLLLIKYLINTYNLTKNNFIKIDASNNNYLYYLFSSGGTNKMCNKICLLHILFSSGGTNKMCNKICLYIFNKFSFTKNDILAKNIFNKSLLSSCCQHKCCKLLKYLIKKYKFTKNDLKHLNKFNSDVKINKILLINDLLNSKYNYSKIFDFIYI